MFHNQSKLRQQIFGLMLRLQQRLVTRHHALASIALFIFALASLWPVQSARETAQLDEPAALLAPE